MITVYFGGCWSSNIGNAFIDIGALESCNEYNPYLYSEYDYIMFGNNRRNYFNSFADLKPKCVFFSGMVMSSQFLIDQKEILDIIDKNEIPIVLNGVGGENYSSREISDMRRFIRQHKFAGFISRDQRAYDLYNDLFDKSYSGIDVAFFMNDAKRYKPLLEVKKKYTVINEDDLGFKRDISKFSEYAEGKRESSLVYTHHQLTRMPSSYTVDPDTMLSELPDSYISMYALSKATFSTRVHACVATLAFGGKAMLSYDTPRSALFDRVGAKCITDFPCSIDLSMLADLKGEHRAALGEIMKDVYV